MRQRLRDLVNAAIFAGGAAAVVLTMALPRTTHAEPIADIDRQGEWAEEGMKFGNILVRGELVADGSAPGGWALLRTLENQSDAPESCVLEERVTRTETMMGARVTPPATAVLLRNQPIALAPHEKKSIGVRLPPSLGAQITAAHRTRALIERAYARTVESGKVDPFAERTFMTFEVAYFTPLPAGATAAPPEDNGVRRPQALGWP
jgi:hypothetical protein